MKEDANIYILHGEAQVLVEEAFAELVAKFAPETNLDFNYDVFDGETSDVSHVISAANMLPVFSDKRLVVVRRAEKYLEGKKSEALSEDDEDEASNESSGKDVDIILNYSANPNPQTTLILVASKKLDARRKSFKQLNKSCNVLAFTELQYKDAVNWLIDRARLKYNKKLSVDAAQFLLTAVGRDTSVLSSELEKLSLYCIDKKEIEVTDVHQLSPQDSNIAVFDFIDALVDKKLQKALDILQELLNRGEYPARIVAVLATQLRSLISVKALRERSYNNAEIAKQLGFKGEYIIQKYIRQEKHFAMSDLIEALQLLAVMDSMSKIGGGEAQELLLNTVMRIAGFIK